MSGTCIISKLCQDEAETNAKKAVNDATAPKTLAILTGGGPAPGLNAVIYGTALTGLLAGWRVLGFHDGWKGVLYRNYLEITPEMLSRMNYWESGTILGTSRTNLLKMPVPGSKEKSNECPAAAQILRGMNVKALVPTGGEDTIGVGEELFREHNIPVNCVPKTIDNDVCGTERTFGWDTACNTVAQLIRSMHKDFESTHYVGVVEIMGRASGWLTLYGGLAGGAHIILIPEDPQPVNQIMDRIMCVHQQKGYCLLAVSEELNYAQLSGHIQESGGLDNFDHAITAARTKGWGKVICEEIEERTGLKARPIVFGHAQRGGDTSALDTAMCLQLGQRAAEECLIGNFGQLISWKNEAPCPVPLALAGGGQVRNVPVELYRKLTALLP
jgi:6-phosphofructokinase 1